MYVSVSVLRGLQSAPPPPGSTVTARDVPSGRGELCQTSVVCLVFPPLVFLYGLFPVLVSCHYELILFQVCVCDYVFLTMCI